MNTSYHKLGKATRIILRSANINRTNRLKVTIVDEVFAVQVIPNLVHEAFNLGDVDGPVSGVDPRHLGLVKVDQGLEDIVKFGLAECHLNLL
jgi:hypothetical protein